MGVMKRIPSDSAAGLYLSSRHLRYSPLTARLAFASKELSYVVLSSVLCFSCARIWIISKLRWVTLYSFVQTDEWKSVPGNSSSRTCYGGAVMLTSLLKYLYHRRMCRQTNSRDLGHLYSSRVGRHIHHYTLLCIVKMVHDASIGMNQSSKATEGGGSKGNAKNGVGSTQQDNKTSWYTNSRKIIWTIEGKKTEGLTCKFLAWPLASPPVLSYYGLLSIRWLFLVVGVLAEEST